MFLQQKGEQMGNNLGEQQVNNNNKTKAKQQTQEQLSSSRSQVLKTYNFGNFENFELDTGITLIYPHLHPLAYHVCRDPHRRASSSLLEYVRLVHIDPASFINKSNLPLQMEAHW